MGKVYWNEALKVKVRLPEERWTHIIESHPEMKQCMQHVIQAILHPDKIYISAHSNNFILIKNEESFISDNVLIHVKKEADDAFVISAHPISNKNLKKIEKKWTRVNL